MAPATPQPDVRADDAFLDKWRARWPEWAVCEVFLAPADRDAAAAWFALQQEFADAAWSGSDAAPGLAKLAWWQEELRGWARGAYRHPLGRALQPRTRDAWTALADALPVLRDRALPGAGVDAAMAALAPLSSACAAVEADLFGRASEPVVAAAALLSGPLAAAGGRAASARLRDALPRRPLGAAPVRLLAGVLRRRLGAAASGAGWRPVSRWRLPWLAWRAARN